MDTATSRAIVAVHLADDATQKQWFELVCQTYDQLVQSGQLDWSQFTAALVEAASEGVGRHIAEQFVESMAANDLVPIETIGRMRELASELDVLYRQLAAEATAGREAAHGGDGEQSWNAFPVEHGTQWTGDRTAGASSGATAGGYDESAWNAFLVEHGARWNGAESAWEQFKSWFLYQAEQRMLTTPGNGFITYVEGQSDKAAAFAQYGIALTARASTADGPAAPADVSTFPDMKPGDSGEWVDYLDAMLTSNGF